MDTIKKILLVVDPTVDRDFVIDRAKLVAKSSEASITLFINNENTLTDHSYIYDGVDGSFFETQRKLFEDHYKKILSDLKDEMLAENLDAITVFTEHHHLAEAIIDQAIEQKVDLVMKSTHQHGALERSLVTNTDWRLIRKCPAPLLLVKEKAWQEPGAVVAAVDPLHPKAVQSKLDHELIAYTEHFSAFLNQQAHVFHSYFPFVSSMYPLAGESALDLEKIREQHAAKMNELLQSHNIAPANVLLSQGEVAPHLIKYLDSVNANILVIGALSKNVIERAIVGNTAEKILQDCPCDILVIKPGDKK